MSDEKFVRYFYYPDPDLGSKYIPGVNPSITKLVDALLSWGVHTTGATLAFFQVMKRKARIIGLPNFL